MRVRVISMAFAATALMAACGGDETEGTTTAETCGNTVSIYPEDGAQNVYYRTTIEANFKDAEEGATMAVDVDGSTEWDGDTLVFTPDQPLDSMSSYSVSVDYSCGTTPISSFTTSEVGASVDSSGLVGKAYLLDLLGGRWVLPNPEIGLVLGGMLTTPIMIGVDSVTEDTIKMIGAVGPDTTDKSKELEQDMCSTTMDFPEASFDDNPFFNIGPETTDLQISSYTITVDDLLVSGAFGPDGSYVDGAVLAGTIDTRPLVPLLSPDGDEGFICDMAATLNVACETCSDGTDFCLTILVDSMFLVDTGFTLEIVEDPCDDPVCAKKDKECTD